MNRKFRDVESYTVLHQGNDVMIRIAHADGKLSWVTMFMSKEV